MGDVPLCGSAYASYHVEEEANPRYLGQWADVRVRRAHLGTGRDHLETVKTRGYNTTPEALALGSG